MGRFYSEDEGDMPQELWEANLYRSIRGKSGQRFLAYLKTALLNLPKPELHEEVLYERKTAFDLDSQAATDMPDDYTEERMCALGAVLRQAVLDGQPIVTSVSRRPPNPETKRRRRVIHSTITTIERYAELAEHQNEEPFTAMEWAQQTFRISGQLAWHIGWLNDEQWEGLDAGERYRRFMEWLDQNLVEEAVAA